MPTRRLPPLTALKAFEAYGRHLNLKEAASELLVTESAVSRQLKLIEEHLGAKLFEKVGRKNQLTDTGVQYLDVISKHLGEISLATDLMFPKEAPASQRKKLMIGSNQVFAEYWLTPRLGNFTKKHPSTEIELHLNNERNVYLPLDHVDVEIFEGFLESDNHDVEKLHLIRDFPVCSPAFLAGFKDGAEAMQKGTKIHELSYHWWPNWLKEVGLIVGKFSNDGPLILDERLPVKMAVLGQGIAMGDDISCVQLLADGDLVKPIPEIHKTDVWMHMITRKQNFTSPHITYFQDWLRAEMKVFNDGLAS